MGSQIDSSIEQMPLTYTVDAAMQEAMENLELNPPPEFLDALSWDRPSQGSGSMMKFKAPFPPLSSEKPY